MHKLLNTTKHIGLFVLLCFSTLCFATEKSIQFSSPNNKIFVSRKNPVFTLTLHSNPTTGFSWAIKSYDKNLISLVDHKFIAPKNKKLIGAPGYEVWTFKFKANKGNAAVNPVGHIIMKHRRPWTKNGATTKSFVVEYSRLIRKGSVGK